MNMDKRRLSCDICGGQLEIIGSGKAKCLYCEAIYSVQSLKEKYENITVNVTGSKEDVEKWRSLLHMYMNTADYIHAESVVNKILEAEPTDEEAKLTYAAIQKLKYFEIHNGVLEKYTGSEDTVCIPGIVEKISSRAFENYSYEDREREPIVIKKITIPKGVKEIIKQTFANLRGLQEVVLPDGLDTIGDNSFSGCVLLKSINFPESLKSIGKNAFYGCSSLITGILPNSVSYIGEGAFENCTSISNINIPTSLSSISDRAFRGCSSLKMVTLPASITEIGFSAFSGCESLTTVVLPDTITTIGSCAFAHCSSMTTINLPDSISRIEGSAFDYCKSLKKIEAPAEAMIRKAFDGCSLEEVKYKGIWYKTASKADNCEECSVLQSPYYFGKEARERRQEYIARKKCTICHEPHKGLLTKVCFKCILKNNDWIHQSEDFIHG